MKEKLKNLLKRGVMLKLWKCIIKQLRKMRSFSRNF